MNRRRFLQILAGTAGAAAIAPYVDPMEQVRRLWPGWGVKQPRIYINSSVLPLLEEIKGYKYLPPTDEPYVDFIITTFEHVAFNLETPSVWTKDAIILHPKLVQDLRDDYGVCLVEDVDYVPSIRNTVDRRPLFST